MVGRGLYFPLFGKIIYGIIRILGTFRIGFLEMIKKIFPTFKESFFFLKHEIMSILDFILIALQNGIHISLKLGCRAYMGFTI